MDVQLFNLPKWLHLRQHRLRQRLYGFRRRRFNYDLFERLFARHGEHLQLHHLLKRLHLRRKRLRERLHGVRRWRDRLRIRVLLVFKHRLVQTQQ